MTESEIHDLVAGTLEAFCHDFEDRIFARMSSMVRDKTVDFRTQTFEALEIIREILADMAPPDDDVEGVHQ